MPVQKRPPAISGVSAGKTAVIATAYPSIAATFGGKLLGMWLDCLPMRIGGIKLSHLLFGLPAAGLAVPGFAMQRLFAPNYVLTNRSVQLRKPLSGHLIREVPLNDVDRVVVRQLDGQQFYPAAEIDLLDKSGSTLLTLSGVLRADVFRQSILEARDARRQVEASLKTIEARQTAATA